MMPCICLFSVELSVLNSRTFWLKEVDAVLDATQTHAKG